MRGTLILVLMFAGFSALAQNEQALINSDWYISNFTRNNDELLKEDTLILRRFEWDHRKGGYADSTFNPDILWSINFDDLGEFSVGWVDYEAAAKGRGSIFYHEMYPRQNCTWKLRRKTICFYLDGVSLRFKISKYRKNQYKLIKCV